MLDHTDLKWRPATKSVCKTAPKYPSILSTATVSTLQTSNAAGSIPYLSYGHVKQLILSQNEMPTERQLGLENPHLKEEIIF